MRMFACLVVLLAFCTAAPVLQAQLPNATDTTATPAAGPHDYMHSPVETVNPANGSVSVRIPVRMSPGRQLTVPFSFAYDSNGSFYVGSKGGAPLYLSTGNLTNTRGGWSYSYPAMSFQGGTWTIPNNNDGTITCHGSFNYVFQDPSGNRHNVALSVSPNVAGGDGVSNCNQGVQGDGEFTTGGEGPILATTTIPVSNDGTFPGVVVTDGNGTIYNFGRGNPGTQATTKIATSVVDRNGNTLTVSGTSAFSYTDTVGRTALSVSGLGGNPDTVTLAGLSTPYKVYWTSASASFSDNMVNLDPGLYTNCPTTLSGSTNPVSEIELPNGQQFTFTYDPTYGMLTKIVYPSGGYVRYVWGLNPQAEAGSFPVPNEPGYLCRYDFPAITDRYVSYDGTTETLHQQFAYSTTWQTGSTNNLWTSKQTTVTTTDTVRNVSFSTVYNYSPLGVDFVPNCAQCFMTEQVPTEQTIKSYATTNTSGSPLKTVTKNWVNVRILHSQDTTLDNNQSSLSVYCYNTNEEVTETDEYDLGTSHPSPAPCGGAVSGASGPLLRKTTDSYASFTAHIVDLPATRITYDGSGNRVAEADSYYDQTGSSNRGNLTTITQLCLQAAPACASGNPTTKYTYDANGQVLTMVDPDGNATGGTPSQHTTTYSYTDSYSSCGGNAPPTSPSDAYLTKITYPQTSGVNHIVNHCYDYTSGLMRSSMDENNQTTQFTYADSLDRLTEIDYPDTGQTVYTYNDTPPTPTITTEKRITAGNYVTSVSTMNGMGMVTKSQLTSDPQGTDITLTTYDGLGHTYQAYNPYRTTGDPTYGHATYAYDVLDRTISVTKQDNSVVTTSYCGQETLVTDEAGHWRRSKADGLGRLIEVDEPNSTTATVNVCPGTGEPIWVTTYSYDTLNNLVGVVQGGSHSRSFAYNSLKQMLQSTNPESATICYGTLSGSTCQQNGYDANGNVIYKTDARSITTTATYDALNRATGLTYSNSDPSVSYTYDQSACLGQPFCYNIGHRSTMTDAGGTENLAYDKMGRELTEQRTTNTVTKSTLYAYDLAGDLTSLTYPSGRMITYTFDLAGHPTEAQDVANGINYVTGPCGSSSASVCYSAFGAMEEIQNGTNLFTTHLYNTRLQPCWMYTTTGTALATKTSCTATDSTPGNILDLKYNFSLGSGDNGNVIGITNNRDTTRTQSFTYDQVNRIVSGAGSTYVQSSTHCWGETYTYDQWANMYAFGVISSSYNGCVQDSLSVSATSANQLSATGYSYDTAGNMLTDGANTYGYNAESEIKSAAGVNYTYDGDGNRLQKSNGKIYWYGAGTEILDESDASGNFTNEYVFFGGKRIAMRAISTGIIDYYSEDMLGSSRTIVQAGQTTPCYDADFRPFGSELTITSTCTPTYKFEGKERDTESGNDDFGARYYSSRLGRWLSADWSAVPVPVPYANLTNPQTLNLYAMVNDNPESFADLSGHCVADSDCVDKSSGSNVSNSSSNPNPNNNPNNNTTVSTCAVTTTACPTTNTAPNQNVSPEVKAAIADAVKASNSPTADDKKGGYHEEGGIWGTTTSGGTVVAPAQPGPYSGKDDKTAHIDPGKSVNPSLKDNMKSLDGTWHVHPRGGSDKTFVQPPSGVDKANALAPINIVVGAENKRVYFYNSAGVVREMSLKDFMKEPQ